MSFFSTIDTGITLNRFSQDLQLIDMELPLAALNTFASMTPPQLSETLHFGYNQKHLSRA
jgi:hypothetical protein